MPLLPRTFPLRLAAVLALGIACRDVTAPERPPYIAILTTIHAPPGVTAGGPYVYRVRELSGTLAVDRSIQAMPADTIVLSVAPATYSIELGGLPAVCSVRPGPGQSVLVSPNVNTAVVRFAVTCRAPLLLTTFTDGTALDSTFLYEIRASDGALRRGLVRANDTLSIDSLPPGAVDIELRHVATNCVVVNSGGSRLRLDLPGGGGAEVAFRVICSDPARRPQILLARGSASGGAAAVHVIAYDPQADIERYEWGLTDCSRRWLTGAGPRLRRGLTGGRTAGQDTVIIVAAFEIPIDDPGLASACMTVRVMDEEGNTTQVEEWPLRAASGRPRLSACDARIFGTHTLRASGEVQDPDDDFVGFFGAARLRDGVLGPADGTADIGVFNAAGYLGTWLPDVPLGSPRPRWDDYYAIILYAIDARGNFARCEAVPRFQ